MGDWSTLETLGGLLFMVAAVAWPLIEVRGRRVFATQKDFDDLKTAVTKNVLQKEHDALVECLEEKASQKDVESLATSVLMCATRAELNGAGGRVDKLDEKTTAMYKLLDHHSERITRLEEKVVEPMQRIMDRLDTMQKSGDEQAKLLDRTAHTLSALATTVDKLERRIESHA